jgi:hypothetical protein
MTLPKLAKMKTLTQWAFVAFTIIGATIFLSCRAQTGQKNMIEKSIIVFLRGELNSDYLAANYLADGYQRADRVSRSQNKWNVKLKKVDKLLEKLKADGSIEDAYFEENEPGTPTNSTNEGSSKTQPIKK